MSPVRVGVFLPEPTCYLVPGILEYTLPRVELHLGMELKIRQKQHIQFKVSHHRNSLQYQPLSSVLSVHLLPLIVDYDCMTRSMFEPAHSVGPTIYICLTYFVSWIERNFNGTVAYCCVPCSCRSSSNISFLKRHAEVCFLSMFQTPAHPGGGVWTSLYNA